MVQGYIRARLWPSCFVTPKLECASLRTHAQLRATCGVLWRAWSDGVVPLRVELVALDIEARPLLVANLDPLGFGAQFGWWAQSGRWTRFQAMRCDTGIPSRVIRLSTAQPTRASVFWAGRFRARRPRPIRAL